MKILYISTVCSPKILDEIFKTSKIKPGQAAQKFHRLLVEGFCKHNTLCTIDVLSALPVTTSSHEKKWWNIKKEIYKTASFQYIPFLNFNFIKHIFVFIITFFKVLFWRINNWQEKRIVICDILNNGIVWSTFIACKLSRQKMVVLVTDLPTMVFTNNEVIKLSLYKRIILNISNFVMYNFDYYILLTHQMNEMVNPNNKPFLIIEGLVDTEIEVSTLLKNKKKIILYAGALYEKFGVKKLMKAFTLINNNELELHLYGSGDLDKSILKYCNDDTRIKFFGVVKNEYIVNKLTEASLLVNPRPSFEKFTKYSFPSKNMEYMVSGTPLLTSKLQGMPIEYYDYVYLFEDETISGMAITIEQILLKSSDELISFGLNAQKFVLNQKSNEIQAKKILEWLC